ARERRRAVLLRPHRASLRRIVFTKHYDLGGSHYAYTEGQSDAQAERHFAPGAALCLLELDDLYGRTRVLIDDPNGVIRDPDVSYDGKCVLFAWKKSDREDDYHLYEMTVASGDVRQITFGLGFADYEGAYLPNGDIVFNSTRAVQTVDCWWTEVSNIYTCDRQGRFLRRLGFDAVHTNFPTVLEDGRVIYTRWEYNDRGQIFPQGLFQMNADGTAQTEFYGNNSWFPTSILHARGIPGAEKAVAILSGHHSRQNGKLAILDPRRGRQENSGAQLIAPIRETPAVRIDAYGQDGDQFQYPYPLSETEFLAACKPADSGLPFAIYFMTIDGERELLAADRRISCNQPIPLAPRPTPHLRPSSVDYRTDFGVYYAQDVYAGPGLEGVPRGTVQGLRVIALEYRAAGVGSNGNRGPAGGALISTPVSIDGTWDVKRILGTARVHEDGSASFKVPARTPVYFQALDGKNHAVQTMRSWSTLQPGERFSCVGCHESKNGAPPHLSRLTLAMKAGPQDLEPFHKDSETAPGFSFEREIQPILDRRCVRCHRRRDLPAPGATPKYDPAAMPGIDGALVNAPPPAKNEAFSLLGEKTFEPGSLRKWSDAYKALVNRNVISWISPQSVPSMLEPYHAGAARSPLIALLEKGHGGAKLSQEEMDRVAAWIDLLVPFYGDYAADLEGEALAKYEHFLEKRKRWQEQENKNIAELTAERGRP
ncbi:MAG TPA: hypothetical protein VM492_09330, partial [Sumerlaeia bacterium]|nr:hypothetical protein [Sumerlaeia bacterium]